VRKLTPLAIDLAIKFAKGEKVPELKMFKLADLTLDAKRTGEVACLFLPVVQVDKNNVYNEVIKTGFQKWDAVYRDIPADKKPPKP
jgi:D-xylose transport system substrate-binding protein